MNLLDEMLFLNPAPYLPAFFVNTVYYQLGRQSTGTRGRQLVKTALVWVQLLQGRWYRAKEWIWPEPLQSEGINCSLLTSCNAFSEHTERIGRWMKGGHNLGGSFLTSTQHNSYLDQRKMISHLWYHTIPLKWQPYSNFMNFLCSLCWQTTRCSQRLAGSEGLGLGWA